MLPKEARDCCRVMSMIDGDAILDTRKSRPFASFSRAILVLMRYVTADICELYDDDFRHAISRLHLISNGRQRFS